MKKIVLLAAAAGLSTVVMADALGTAPGTKARAMGGAFTAIANNTSALYFNPAGLIAWEKGVKPYGTFTAEIGSAVKLDVEAGRADMPASYDDFIDSYTNYFWGFSSFGKDVGFAIGSYSLNSLVLPYTVNGSTAYYTQENKIISGAIGFKLTDSLYPGGGKISLGATLGYAQTNDFFEDTTIDYETGQVKASSMLWSVGIKARVLESEDINIDLGVNYRAATEYEPDTYSSQNIVPWDIPAETALGVAVMIPTEFATITLAYDYKMTGYADATDNANDDYIHTSLGAMEDMITQSFGAELAFSVLQLRAGYYSDELDGANSTDHKNSLTSSGISGGVGFSFGAWNIEGTVEQRHIETPYLSDVVDDDEVYYSASMNYTF